MTCLGIETSVKFSIIKHFIMSSNKFILGNITGAQEQI
jgi:hypothetical protein